jgi:hypothetical protein
VFLNRCQFEDILLEMDRILRPEGAVIIRDKVDVLVKVEKIANAMRWKTRLADHVALMYLRRFSSRSSNTGTLQKQAANVVHSLFFSSHTDNLVPGCVYWKEFCRL